MFFDFKLLFVPFCENLKEPVERLTNGKLLISTESGFVNSIIFLNPIIEIVL